LPIPEDLNAEFIGKMALNLIDVAIERGYNNKNKIGSLRRKADAAHMDGVRATARYLGARSTVVPFVFTPTHHITEYERERERIAREFLAIEDELLSRRCRGRPPASSPDDNLDYRLIAEAMTVLSQVINIDEPAASLRKKFAAILNEKIVEFGLRQVGETKVDFLETHRRRIMRKVPQLIEALRYQMGMRPN
jgi:hypothetical protein